jgi:hypothetical protein
MTLNIRFVPAGEVTLLNTTAGLVIEMFRSNKFCGDRGDGLNGFRPAKVLKGDIPVWTFQTSGAKEFEFADLVDYDGEYVIVIRDKFSVSNIVRVNDFEHGVLVKLAGRMMMIGGSTVKDLLEIKIAVSGQFKVNYWKSPEEIKILEALAENLRATIRRNQEEQAVAKAAARTAREAFIQSILKRSTVEAWSSKGQKFFGVPITEDEWMALPDGKYCVLMKDGTPVEAFIVDKKGSSVKKARATEVFAEMPTQQSAAAQEKMPEALDQIKVTLRGETRSVPMFENMEALQELRRRGLNSGTWVCLPANNNKPITVYAIRTGNIETVGQVAKKV